MNKKIFVLFLCCALIVSLSAVSAKKAKDDGIDTIKEGEVLYSSTHYLAGEVIPCGYDEYGYNYQAHLFKGSFSNVYFGSDGLPAYNGDDEAYLSENPEAEGHWTWPYRNIQLIMKWNDAWLSNCDRDQDGKLDRHWGYDSYIGSGAWETNHQSGVYTQEDIVNYGLSDEWIGTHWTYFTKIVAVPSDAILTDGVWYTVDGVEIGPDIWGAFATIQEVWNDPPYDVHGLYYISPLSAGFGIYKE